MDIKEPREDPQQEPLPGEYGFPLPRELLYRELGFGGCFAYHNNPRHSVGKKIVTQSLSSKAVNTLCTKELTRRRFKLPTGARTTFHIAFSADGSKVASCHGDHNVYVCDVASGEVIQTLSGHPRTPWCVVFHPTQNDVLASGCLAGQVRVWDLKGGSEVLVTDSGTVIASLAFHPTVRLLAIATFNEIIFWDWGHPYPLARCSTENTKEKVRLVRFDRFGHNLITGITNFPSPPSRDEIRRPARSSGGGEGHLYRPNILTRNNRLRRASPVFVSSRDEMETVEDGEGEVVEEVVVPDHEETFSSVADDALIVRENLNARQDRFQESYRQLVSHYEELVSNYQQFLRSRIPRIYETSDDPAPAPTTLALADPILDESQDNPDMEINPMEDTFETDSLPSDSTAAVVIVNTEAERIEADDNSTTIVTNAEPTSLPVVMDDELPGPSSRLLFLPNQDAPVDFPRESNLSTSSMEPHSPSSRSSISGTTVEGESTGARNDTDLRSIEALAQNILEMQNLCSQVRMDAPLAVENQHIMELRVIRRHLELLQEQTRDLQSSIRATLNSLATGSLAALRSHVANATNSALGNLNENPHREASESLVNLEQATPPTPAEPGPNLEFDSHSPTLPTAPRSTLRMETRPETSEVQSRHARREATQSGPARSGSNGSSSRSGGAPSTLYRIMIATPYSESGRVTTTPLFNRIRVPPMVAMQYEVSDSFSRNTRESARNSEEPIAGTSRDATGVGGSSGSSNTNRRGRTSGGGEDGQAGPRRIVREFHLVSGRPGTLLAEEHARHCPFSGRDPYQWRPPPRMRSLYDMGEMPPLVTWPTMETGVEVNTRNFRAVSSSSSSNRQSRSPVSSITITIRGGFGNGIPNANNNGQHESFEGSNNRIAPFMNFSQWLLSSGINSGNLTSDVLIGIYLTIRQLSGNSNSLENLESQNSEQWQRAFRNIVPGLALIPPSLRQGQRTPHHQSHRCQHRRRRTTHWICYNHNGTSSQSSSRHGTLPPAGVRANNTSHNSNQDDQSNNNEEPPPNANSTPRAQTRVPLNIPEESSSSSSSSSSSGYSSSSSEPICMRTTKKENESCATSTNTASTSHNSSLTRPVPSQLESNFSRVFYIRAADDLIPVYSTVHSSETGLGTEVRESLQASVYYLPIGLFLQGGPWEANTQAVGIHWPPVTREEEYAILDLRVSERPLAVFGTSTRESFPNNRNYPRIRLDYDQTSLRVILPTGFTLQFIQSGLMLLDCISNSVNLPRPRALEGTLWIDYLGPFFDALERMFGLRHARRTITNLPPGHHRVGAFLRRTPPRVHEHGGRPSMFSNGPSPSSASSQPASSSIPSSSQSNTQDNSSSSGSNNNTGPNRERPATSTSRRAEVGERLRSVTTRRIITLAPDSSIESNRRRFYDDGSMILSHGYMYDGASSGGGNYRSNVGDRRFYFRHRHSHRNDYSHHHHRSGQSQPHHGTGNSQGNRGQDASDGSRFIRLAVDTAASEVLRRNQQHHLDSDNLPVVEAGSAGGFSTLGRPVESRIERVLNERGNRGVHSPSPPGILDESVRNRMRLEEIQMRISMLSQWSRARAMATSGTQTPPSFIRGWQMSTVERPSSSSSQTEGANHSSERERNRRAAAGESSGDAYRQALNLASVPSGGISDNESRTSRRRPYSRIARFLPNETDDNSEEEMLLSIPARIPRLGDQPLQPQSEYEGERRGRTEIIASSRREGGRGGVSAVRQRIDHWVMRSGQPPTSSLHRYRPAAVVELSGSARTRAPPPVSENNGEPTRPANTSNEAAGENESIGRGFHRGGAGRARGTSNATGVNGSNNPVGNDREEQQHLDAGARFYPGYIPEILITPRTRPPTYYTMDAATTAFLSSRIQKWDFTEFLIPDITKRDDFVVVRECSLHSDACLDVSPDSAFLAVLQPSDSGSYSSVGLYSLQDESLGELLNVYHFDQNTVSVSISPSCDYLVVGYAGRGPLYRFVHPSRNIGKIISIARDEDDGFRLVHVKDLYADGQVAFMSINCMHWVPVSGYGIIYGTNTGDLVLLS